MARRPFRSTSSPEFETPELTPFIKGKRPTMSHIVTKGKATKAQWEWIDIAIKAFMTKYPKVMSDFLQEMATNRTKYQDVDPRFGNTDLKKANWRNVASFPVVTEIDPDTGEEVVAESLLVVLKRIIPDLTDTDSKNFDEFMRRYPMFRPGEKI